MRLNATHGYWRVVITKENAPILTRVLAGISTCPNDADPLESWRLLRRELRNQPGFLGFTMLPEVRALGVFPDTPPMVKE
jgi:hypothetical protein